MDSDFISVLIVDDHAVVRSGIIGLLNTQPDIKVVGQAASGKEALSMVAEYVPNVVLMDLLMPEMDGVTATVKVKALSPHTQVVILTSYHDDEHIFPAIQAGALSYVLKDIGPKELIETIRAAARGDATLHPQVARRLMLQVQKSATSKPDLFEELTNREREVLLYIANGLSNAEIADRLVITHQTVKGYVSNILGKLNVADRTQAAIYAWRSGLVSADDESAY